MYSTVRRNFAILIFLLLALPLMAQMPQPFSADFTSTHRGGRTMSGKIYVSSPHSRVEMKGDPGQQRGPFGGDTIMIVDGATKTNYMLMPQMQMYMEFHGDDDRANPSVRNLQSMMSAGSSCPEGAVCKKLGTEVVNGRSCDKFEITDKKGTSTHWIDQKLHIPIRLQQADGTQTDYTNIKEGPQDPSLFKVPAGYRPFDPSAFGGQRRPH